MLGEKQFVAYYKEVYSYISEYMSGMAVDWVQKHCVDMIDYSTQGSTLTKGKTTASAYLEITGHDPNSIEAEVGYTLGWIVEFIDAAYVMANDMMYRRDKRYNKLCWYQVKDVDDQGVNDAIIVENLAFILLDSLKGKIPILVFSKLLQELRKINTWTNIGQSIDFIGKIPTMDSYKTVAVYKASYYTFFSPIIVSLIASQKFDLNEKFEDIEVLSKRLGCYYQSLNDYLYYYQKGEDTIIDIKEGNITWCLCKAYELGNAEQKKTLVEKIGHLDSKDEIKKIFDELKIPEHHKDFVQSEEAGLKQDIANLNSKYPKTTIQALLAKYQTIRQ